MGQHAREHVAAGGRVHDEELHEGLLHQRDFRCVMGKCAHIAFESEIEISSAAASLSKPGTDAGSRREIPSG